VPAAPFNACGALEARWGAPMFERATCPATVMGPVGRWIMEWKCDECLFSKTGGVSSACGLPRLPIDPHQNVSPARSNAAPGLKISNDDSPASSSPSKNNALQISALDDAAGRVSGLRSACRSPMPAAHLSAN